MNSTFIFNFDIAKSTLKKFDLIQLHSNLECVTLTKVRERPCFETFNFQYWHVVIVLQVNRAFDIFLSPFHLLHFEQDTSSAKILRPKDKVAQEQQPHLCPKSEDVSCF